MFKDSDRIAIIARSLIGVPFLITGIGKITAPTAYLAYIASVGLPAPPLCYAIAIAVEIGGGLLLILGLQTRLIAAGLAAFTIVAALVFHTGFADQNQLFHFLKNVVMAGGLLQVAAFGAGRFSLDARRTQAHGTTGSIGSSLTTH
jgi:putative oxidoreductase